MGAKMEQNVIQSPKKRFLKGSRNRSGKRIPKKSCGLIRVTLEMGGGPYKGTAKGRLADGRLAGDQNTPLVPRGHGCGYI